MESGEISPGGQGFGLEFAGGESALDIASQKAVESHHQTSWLGELFGTIYTTVWAAAWYPQVHSNYKAKSAIGYCYDLIAYNVYGFMLYSIYTVTQYQYQETYGLEEAVDWQDIFFAFHSLSINVFYMCQAWYYDGRHFFCHVGWFCRLYMFITATFLVFHVLLALLGIIPWVSVPGAIDANGTAESNWSVVEYMGIVKAIITVIKYPSQVVFNYDRRSTYGMSVLGFVMDLFGGAAALAQNVTDSIIFSDFAFMSANIPKVIVAGSSLFWDSILIYQGAYLYRNAMPLPIEQRISTRKPDTKIAKILEFFAPAPWPPVEPEVKHDHNENVELGTSIGKDALYDTNFEDDGSTTISGNQIPIRIDIEGTSTERDSSRIVLQ